MKLCIHTQHVGKEQIVNETANPSQESESAHHHKQILKKMISGFSIFSSIHEQAIYLIIRTNRFYSNKFLGQISGVKTSQ